MEILGHIDGAATTLAPISLAELGVFCRVLAAAFVLGAATGWLYAASHADDQPHDAGLTRAFVILVPALAVVFWVIKFNVVLSLGLLGSLAFVRFRTPIRRTEDAAFVLVGIAVAITVAVEAYALAVLLLASIFVLKVGGRWLLGARRAKGRYAVVTFQSASVHTVERLVGDLGLHKHSPRLLSARSYDGWSSFVFGVRHTHPGVVDEIRRSLATLDRQAQLHVFYPDDRLGT